MLASARGAALFRPGRRRLSVVVSRPVAFWLSGVNAAMGEKRRSPSPPLCALPSCRPPSSSWRLPLGAQVCRRRRHCRGKQASGRNRQPSPAARRPAPPLPADAAVFAPLPDAADAASPRPTAYGFASYGFAVCASSYAPMVCAAHSDTAHGTACGTVCDTVYDTAKRRCAGRFRAGNDTANDTEYDTEYDTDHGTPNKEKEE